MSTGTDKVADATVESLMSRDVATIHEKESIHDALGLMLQDKLTAVPVVNFKNQCIGILSKTDLIEWIIELDERYDQLRDNAAARHFSDGSAKELSVGEFMSQEPVTISPESTVSQAAQIMSRRGIHHLPVVGTSGKIEGIVSSMDVVKLFAR